MRKVLIILATIVVTVVGFAAAIIFITPTKFAVERSIVVNKPKAEVFDYVSKLKNQNEWGPWVRKDPKVKLTYTGEDGKEGFISRWESDHEELGTGEQEIKKITDGDRIDFELRFEEPWESTSQAYLATQEETANKTKVRWGFTGEMPRPMNIMLVLTDFEALVGKDFEEGLGELKKVLESKKSEAPEEESKEDSESEETKKDGSAE